jgi:hypothetical protein
MREEEKNMRKYFLVSVLVLLSILFISDRMFAQRYSRNALSDEYLYELNLTDEQVKAINELEIQLEKELTPFLFELRKLYIKFDELEMQKSPEREEIDKLIGKIESVEDEVIEKEIQLKNKVRDLLTKEQRAVFDSSYGYGAYLRPWMGRFGYGLGPYRFRGGPGWSLARGGQGSYGYGWYNRGYGRYNRRFYQRYGYGRRLGQGRLERYYNLRFRRGRWIW